MSPSCRFLFFTEPSLSCSLPHPFRTISLPHCSYSPFWLIFIPCLGGILSPQHHWGPWPFHAGALADGRTRPPVAARSSQPSDASPLQAPSSQLVALRPAPARRPVPLPHSPFPEQNRPATRRRFPASPSEQLLAVKPPCCRSSNRFLPLRTPTAFRDAAASRSQTKCRALGPHIRAAQRPGIMVYLLVM